MSSVWFATFYRTQWTAEGSVFGAISLWFFCLCVKYSVSQDMLNGFAPNWHRRRVWSLARTSLKVKAKGQGHQGQKTAFFGHFSGLHAVSVWYTSLVSSFACCQMGLWAWGSHVSDWTWTWPVLKYRNQALGLVFVRLQRPNRLRHLDVWFNSTLTD